MNIRTRKSPLELEQLRLEKREKDFQRKQLTRKEPKLNQFLEGKIPDKIQGTLESAFIKAFQLVFEKGTGIIEKTYKKEDLEKSFQVHSYAAKVQEDRKSLRTFSKKASSGGAVNLLVSGSAGVGMGLLGIGIPDIVVFTGMILKAVYEISLNYGYEYETEKEKKFILLLIQGAVTKGEAFNKLDRQINELIRQKDSQREASMEECIRQAAGKLSDELLYMKFLQGIPLVGAIGGAYDAVCMKQVTTYVELKYRRRFYTERC